MTRATVPPLNNPLPARITAFVEQLERHRKGAPPLRQVTSAEPLAPSMLQEVLEQLQLEREELAVAEETLRVQLEVMAASEHAREAERVQYREVFDFVPDPLLVTDRRGVVQEANLAALQLLSIEMQYLLGKPLVALVDHDNVAGFLDAVSRLGAERIVERTLSLRARNGTFPRVRVRGALMRDGARVLWSAREGEPVPALEAGAGRQIDALGIALYAQAEALRRLQRENIELAVREQGAREARDAMKEQLDALALAEGVTRLHFEVTDVGALVRGEVEAVRPLATGMSIDLSCAAPAGLVVLGDRLRLIQVVTTILSNALKFTPGGGRIVVRCEPGKSSAEGRTIRVVVEDTGRGVQPGEVDAFCVQGKEGQKYARSLGLYPVRQFVELHGGTVEAEAAGPEGGTRFIVTLPAMAEANGAAP